MLCSFVFVLPQLMSSTSCNCILVFCLSNWPLSKIEGFRRGWTKFFRLLGYYATEEFSRYVNNKRQKCNVFLVYAMKAQRHKYSLLILTLSTRFRRVVNFTPRPLYPQRRTSIYTEQEVVWAPQPVWTAWRKDKFLASVEIRTPNLAVTLTTPYNCCCYCRCCRCCTFFALKKPEDGDKYYVLKFYILTLKIDKVQINMH